MSSFLQDIIGYHWRQIEGDCQLKNSGACSFLLFRSVRTPLDSRQWPCNTLQMHAKCLFWMDLCNTLQMHTKCLFSMDLSFFQGNIRGKQGSVQARLDSPWPMTVVWLQHLTLKEHGDDHCNDMHLFERRKPYCIELDVWFTRACLMWQNLPQVAASGS